MLSLTDIINSLTGKGVTPSWFRSREWATVDPAIRNRSFFSATISSAKVLNKMRSMLLDWQEGATEQTPGGIAYKEVGLAKFRERAAEFLIQEGLAKEDDYADQSIKNVISNARLQLIYNTNLEQAATFAAWQAQIRDPYEINRKPAARFSRRSGAIIQRPRHTAAEGDVRRYDDFAYWTFQNGNDIGGFDVPWGPYGFNSYMVQEPVSRAEAERLGLVQKGEVIPVPDVTRYGVSLGSQFNHGVDATLDDVTPEIRAKAQKAIVARLGPGAIGSDGKPTLDALKQARAAIGKPFVPVPVPVARPVPVPVVRPVPKPVAVPVITAPVQTSGTSPMGSKVSEKIAFGSITGDQQEVKRKWDRVAKIIDSIHGDGPLPPAPVKHKETNGTTNGEFWGYKNEISTYKVKSIPLTLPHEIGHWIDYRGFKQIPEATPPMAKRQFASNSPLFKEFIKLAKKTNKIIAIKNSRLSAKSKSYLRSNHEIFARAYSQWIAIKSKDPEMMTVLRSRQGKPVDGIEYPVHWDDDDFVPLYKEIENIFKKIQWLKT
jgi:hypothetical protein